MLLMPKSSAGWSVTDQLAALCWFAQLWHRLSKHSTTGTFWPHQQTAWLTDLAIVARAVCHCQGCSQQLLPTESHRFAAVDQELRPLWPRAAALSEAAKDGGLWVCLPFVKAAASHRVAMNSKCVYSQLDLPLNLCVPLCMCSEEKLWRTVHWNMGMYRDVRECVRRDSKTGTSWSRRTAT